MIRPLLTACIEYILALVVFKNGKNYKNIIAVVLFFLASYQLGEVFIFMTSGQPWAFKFAYVSTNLLPPLGVLLISRMIKKPVGYIGYALVQLVALAFAVYIISIPQVAVKWELGQFCVRIFEYDTVISNYWLLYYQVTLMVTMLVAFFGYIFVHNSKKRNDLMWTLIAYISFNGGSILISTLNPWFGPSIASLMCALALIASFIFAKIALPPNFNWQRGMRRKYTQLFQK